MTAPATLPARTTSWPLAALLLLGPVLTVTALTAALSRGALTTLSPEQYLLTAVLFWSPLPFSIPAVLLEAHRDAALPRLRGLAAWPVRAVLLLPYLLLSRDSRVRVEVAASLLGFGAAAVLALAYLG